MIYAQYEIVIVNLDPTIGSEIKKTRPCVVISPDEMNRHLDTIVICPITSKSKNYPTRIPFDLDGNENWIVVDQIRTINKKRVTKAIGFLNQSVIAEVKEILRQAFVD